MSQNFMKASINRTIEDYLVMRAKIKSDYGNLSNRLQQIARFALEHPTEMSMETVAIISKKAAVQPSAMIRFATHFGYSGFSEMQRVFQAYVTNRSANHSERIRRIFDDKTENVSWSNAELLQKLCTTNILSLESLSENIDADALNQAIEILSAAERVYLIGARKSFAVAAYLAYTLNHSGIKAYLLNGLGGMLKEQTKTMAKNDALIAITYLVTAEGTLHPEQEETSLVMTATKKIGARSILITDSLLSPMAREATVCIQAHDAETLAFRSLTTAMCVSQTIATALLDRAKS